MTHALLVFDHKFIVHPCGAYTSAHNYTYDTLAQRYLTVFDTLTVLARSTPSESPADTGRVAHGPGVEIVTVGSGNLPRVLHQARQQSAVLARGRPDTVLIGVMPSLLVLAALSSPAVRRLPLGVEVIGDVYEVARSVVPRPAVGSTVGLVALAAQRAVVRSADAVSYVTAAALQERYPHRRDVFTTHYSSVQIDEGAFAKKPRIHPRHIGTPGRPLRLVSVGSMAQPYKGFDILLDALVILRRGGTSFTCTLVGDGRLRGSLEAQARFSGLDDAVTFTGQLPGPSHVRCVLDAADLMVAPSRTEGIPRAVIEAAARGLPAVGSSVGGLPEVVEPVLLVAPGDPHALAERLLGLAAADPADWDRLSTAALKRARDYALPILTRRRQEMYLALAALAGG